MLKKKKKKSRKVSVIKVSPESIFLKLTLIPGILFLYISERQVKKKSVLH